MMIRMEYNNGNSNNNNKDNDINNDDLVHNPLVLFSCPPSSQIQAHRV